MEHRGAMKSLNQEQWKAVTSVVDRVHGAGPYIILGPPGTGKTVTVGFLNYTIRDNFHFSFQISYVSIRGLMHSTCKF